MFEIYSCAKRVIVPFAPNLAKSARDALGSMVNISRFFERSHYQGYKASIDPELFRDFFAAPWFSRIWVIQEVLASSRHVRFKQDEHKVSWQDVQAGYAQSQDTLVAQHRRPVLDTVIWYNANLVNSGTSAARLSRADSLFCLLMVSNACQSSDPRDKLFALLPLFTPALDFITADYRKSKAEAYIQASQELIDRIGPVVLSSANCDSVTGTLPSWATDWSRPVAPKTFRFLYLDTPMSQPRPEVQRPAGSDWNPTFSILTTSHNQALSDLQSESLTYHIMSVKTWSICSVQSITGVSDAVQDRLVWAEDVFLDWRAMNKRFITVEMRDKDTLKQLDDDAIARLEENTFCATISPLRNKHTEPGWTGARLASPSAQDGLARFDFSSSHKVDSYSRYIYDGALIACHNRRFFTTNERYVGLGPAQLTKDDEIRYFPGWRYPFALRRKRIRERQCYTLVGECALVDALYGKPFKVNDLRPKQSPIWEDVDII